MCFFFIFPTKLVKNICKFFVYHYPFKKKENLKKKNETKEKWMNLQKELKQAGIKLLYKIF